MSSSALAECEVGGIEIGSGAAAKQLRAAYACSDKTLRT